MAFASIPKPGTTQPVPPTQATPVEASLPNSQTLDVSVWMPPYLEETFGGALDNWLKGLFASDETTAKVKFEVGSEIPVSQWIYALVTPFSSLLQGLSGDEFLARWQGKTNGPSLLMDANTYDMLTAAWGLAGSSSVQVVARDELLDYAWTHQPALAIVPFEALEPRWKVLPVDGLSPIHKDFDPDSYRLRIPVSLSGDPGLIQLIQDNFSIPASNFDPNKMTVVNLTGVTALVRATAYEMERHGITYPDQDIRDLPAERRHHAHQQ